MIQEVNDILVKEKFLNIRTSIGKYISNVINKNTTIIDLNNFDYLNMAENFLKLKNNKKLKEECSNIKDLEISIAMLMESFVPRRYCIKKKNLSSAKIFKNFDEMKNICPELKDYKLKYNNNRIYLGFETRYRKELYEGEKKMIDEKGLIDFNTTIFNFDKFETKTIEELSSKKLSKIDNFAPVLMDLFNQVVIVNVEQKRILIFNPGTGFGKSYSINEFLSLVKHKEFFNKINYIVYITDRKKNVEEEHLDFIKNHPDVAGLCLPVYSNIDCIKNHFKDFGNLSKVYKEMPEYEDLLKTVIQYDKASAEMKVILEDSLMTKEFNFRRKVKNELLSVFAKKEISEYQDKIKFLQDNEEYGCIMKVYSNILIKSKKIIFMNMDKELNVIDLIIEKQNLVMHSDEKFVDRSVFIIDESDAVTKTMVKSFCESASRGDFDVISVIRQFQDAFLTRSYPAEIMTEDIKIDLENVSKETKELNDKYHFNSRIKIQQDNDLKWLFSMGDKKIYRDKNRSDEQYLYYNEEENVSFVYNKKELDELGIDSSNICNFDLFIKELLKLLHKYYNLVKKIGNKFSKKEGISLTEALKKIVTDLNFNSEEIESLVRNISLMTKENFEYEEDTDVYLFPGELIKVDLESEKLTISIRDYMLNMSPEKYLLNIVKNNGYVILSSATAKNKSIFRNFNLNWKPLRDYIFEFDNHSKKLIEDYCLSNSKYEEKANINIEDMPNDIKKLREEIIKEMEATDFKDIMTLEKKLDGFINDINQKSSERKDAPSRDYYSIQYLQIILYILKFVKNGGSASLILLNYLFENREEEKRLFDDFIESTIKEKYPNINLFYTGAKKLNSTLEEFFKSAKNNNPSFLISSFSTVEKGINIKIKKEFNPITMIPINERGAEKFALLNNGDEVEVDLDGLYIGDINYDYPKIDKKSTGQNRSAEILQCMYYARSYCFKEKAEKYKDDIIYAILSNDLSPFNVIHDIKTSQSTITSFLSGAGQSTGRVGRCDIRMKDTYICFSGNLKTKFRKMKNLNYYISKRDEYITQNFIVKKVFDYIDSEWRNSTSNETIDVYTEMEESNNTIVRLLGDIESKQCHEHKQMLQELKYFSVDKETYEKLIPATQKMFMENKFDGSYSYFEDKIVNDNKVVSCISVKGEYEHEVSVDSLELTEKQKNILESAGFNFNIHGDYILTVKGFELFKGNIGECLSNKFMEDIIGNKFESLPDDVYEKMDSYVDCEEYIIALDAKYFSYASNSFDSRKNNERKYTKKAEALFNYFKKPCLLIEMNAKDNKSDSSAVVPRKLEGLNCILTVQNIWKDNNYSSEVKQKILEEIKKFMEG